MALTHRTRRKTKQELANCRCPKNAQDRTEWLLQWPSARMCAISPLPISGIQAEAKSPQRAWGLHMTRCTQAGPTNGTCVYPGHPQVELICISAHWIGRDHMGHEGCPLLKGQCEWCPQSHEEGAPGSGGQGRAIIVTAEADKTNREF